MSLSQSRTQGLLVSYCVCLTKTKDSGKNRFLGDPDWLSGIQCTATGSKQTDKHGGTLAVGKQFDSMYPVNAGGRGKRKAIVFIFVSHFLGQHIKSL